MDVRLVVAGVDDGVHSGLEGGVRGGPRRRRRRLAHRLLRVGVHPVPFDETRRRRRSATAGRRTGRRAAGRSVMSVPGERGPLAAQLAEHREPGAHVLAALGVVRRQRGHALRRDLRARPAGPGGSRPAASPKRPGSPPTSLQRDEARVAVVGGVLDALRHHRARGLLEPCAQLVRRVGQPRRERVDRVGQVGTRRPCALDGRGEVRRRRPAGTSGRPGTRRAARPVRPAPRSTVRRRGRRAGSPRPAGSSRPPLRLPAATCSAQLRTSPVSSRYERVERGSAAGSTKTPHDLGQRVVAGGAVDRPLVGQLLAGLEDLLDEQPRRRRRPARAAGSGSRAGRRDRPGGRPAARRRRRRASSGAICSWVASNTASSSTRSPASDVTAKNRR